MQRSATRFVGFVSGAFVALALCYLLLSFEITGGPETGTGLTVFVVHVEVFTVYGILVDFVPWIVYVALCGIAGIAGAVIGERLVDPGR